MDRYNLRNIVDSTRLGTVANYFCGDNIMFKNFKIISKLSLVGRLFNKTQGNCLQPITLLNSVAGIFLVFLLKKLHRKLWKISSKTYVADLKLHYRYFSGSALKGKVVLKIREFQQYKWQRKYIYLMYFE